MKIKEELKKQKEILKRCFKEDNNIFHIIKRFFIYTCKDEIENHKDILHILVLPLSIFYFEMLLKIIGNTINSFTYPIVFGFALGFLINVFNTSFKEKINKIITAISLFILSVVYIVECLVKQTYQIYMTMSTILSGATGVATEYSKELMSIISSGLFIIFLFLIPFILYIVLNKKHFRSHSYTWPVPLLNGILSLVLFVSGILGASHGKLSNLYTNQYEFNNATEKFGLATSLRLDMIRQNTVQTLEVEEEIEEEEEVIEEIVYGKNEMNIDFDALIAQNDPIFTPIDQFVKSQTPSSQNEYTGIFKGKNLILICAEAFSHSVINKDLTPTLYRLAHNGFDFTDYYQPAWGGSTSTGEFSMLMGIVPKFGVGSMVMTRDENNYFTMGNQMQRLGYYTSCYHNGSLTFYNRDITHENLGFNKYMALGNGLENMTETTVVTDTDLLCNTFDTYKDKQPFCAYYMTIDGHSDYNASGVWKVVDNREKVESIIGHNMSEYVFNYYCYQMELEKALTKLIEKLEEEGIADDTVIALTSDHYPYGLAYGHSGNTQDYISELYGYSCAGHLGLDKNCCIIWSESLEKGHPLENMQCKITTPTYSLDILPTLSNLFGVEYDSRLLTGRDVFSDQTPLVIWIDYSWKSDKGYYDANSQTFTPADPNENIPQDYVDKMNAIVSNKINLSGQILEYSYYNHLFGNDTLTDSTSLWQEKYGNK